MEEFLGKVSLYDVVARLLAGGLALLLAYFSNLLNVVGDVKEIPIVMFLLCSYGVGIVLEEVSYIWENETWFQKKSDSQKENKKEKALLIIDNREDISEYPLAQMVLADTLRIACIIIAFWKIVYVLCTGDADYVKTAINLVILGILCVIFHYRKEHYKEYRCKRMKDYYNAKMDVNKSVESK